MSKRYKTPPVNFQDFKDTIEREGSIPIEMPDGKMFYVRPPELLPDGIYEQIAKGLDDADVAKAMIDDYDGFVSAGGSMLMLAAIIDQTKTAREAEQGASMGESGASTDS